MYQTSSACTSSLFPVDQLFQLFCLSVVRLKRTLNEAPRCIIVLHEDTGKNGTLTMTKQDHTHCYVPILIFIVTVIVIVINIVISQYIRLQRT